MIVLGIDPGLADTGWGVVEFDGQHYRPVSFGIVTTPAGEDLQKRIYTIGQDLGELALKYNASVVSMEDIFFTKNITSAIPVAKVGMGRADKFQVQEMVKVILKLKSIPRPDHAADALADCICYCSSLSLKDKIGL